MARKLKEKKSYKFEVRGGNAVRKVREYLKILNVFSMEIGVYHNNSLEGAKFITKKIDRETWLDVSRFVFAVSSDECLGDL